MIVIDALLFAPRAREQALAPACPSVLQRHTVVHTVSQTPGENHMRNERALTGRAEPAGSVDSRAEPTSSKVIMPGSSPPSMTRRSLELMAPDVTPIAETVQGGLSV